MKFEIVEEETGKHHSFMTILPIIAPQTLECSHCLASGRIALIFAGESCAEIDYEGRILFACDDCYERLFDEIITEP